MDAGQRRGSTPAPPRLILLGVANLAALLVLLGMLLGRGDGGPAEAARSAQASGPAQASARDGSTASVPRSSTPGSAASPVPAGGAPPSGPRPARMVPGPSAPGAEGEPGDKAPRPDRPGPDPDRAGAGPLPEVDDVPGGGLPGSTPGGAESAGLLARADERLLRRVEQAIGLAVDEARSRSGGRVGPSTAVVSLSIVDVASGRERLARQADLALRPASVQKLVTCASVLLQLGEGHEFVTRFEARGDLRDGVLQGDLVVRGVGDPFYREDLSGSLEPWLDALAAELRAAGIRTVEGALVLDEGTFEEPGPAPAWPPSQDWWQEYCALSGAFSANGGCLTALVTPGRPGAEASTRVRPRHHGLRSHGTVRTSSGGPLDVRVGATATHATVKGSIPAGLPPFEARFAHPDPVALFGHALVGGLEDRGLTVAGGFERERRVPSGTPVASLRSPLAPLVVPVLRDSNNALADQLLLHLGHEVLGDGSRAGGARAVARGLERLGVPTEGLVQVDGSGLSRDDRLTARALTALLVELQRRGGPAFEVVRASLPVAGESGTLARRMQEGPARGRVRAKTGFINGTSALAGYAETLEGRMQAFALIVNYPHFDRLNTLCWKPMGDAICAAIVESDPEPPQGDAEQDH